MLRVSVPFYLGKNKNVSGIGYFYLNNGFIVKQELKLHKAVISTRFGRSEKSDGYKAYSKVWPTRDKVLGDMEYISQKDKKNIEGKLHTLTKKELLEIEEIINNESSGTILSTLSGVLTYVNVKGANKQVATSPLKISTGIYEGYRFYNLFNNEFATSKQIPNINMNEIEEMTIEEWVSDKDTNKLQFSLYNYDKENDFLKTRGFDFSSIKNPTYDQLLGHAVKHATLKSKQYLINILRSKYKKDVMNLEKYKFDFVYQDTKKENTEAAHIYEVHMIKKLDESLDAIQDVNNCLLLTPSVHRAWDRGQIRINPDGKIINTGMEPERFERMFANSKYSIQYSLIPEQIEYLKKRNRVLYK